MSCWSAWSLTRFWGAQQQGCPDHRLPLVSGLRSTGPLQPCRRAWWSLARRVIQPFAKSPLLLPVRSCRCAMAVPAFWNGMKTEAGGQGHLQAGDAAQWVSTAQLGDEYSGRLFYVKRQFKFDERSPRCWKPATVTGSGARCSNPGASTETC